MTVFSLNKSYRHIKRYRQLIEVLSKHGFGFLIERLGLFRLLPLRKRIKKFDGDKPELTRAERLRLVLEELGPTFIKLGQILSTRPDVMPKEYLQELTRLQDKVPPVDFHEIQKVLERELEMPLEEAFREVDPEPLAAASIGQVHRGVLPDGSRVVIKVKRPDIDRIINTDLEILFNLAGLFQERFKNLLIKNPVEIVEEFAGALRKELNYYNEASNIERFRKNFKKREDVVVPRVYWSYSTKNVLTMEEIKGTRLNSLEELHLSAEEKKELAVKGARIFMDQILIHGFFHADPHPGNIIVQPRGKLAFLDFGIMGRLSGRVRKIFASIFLALLHRDAGDVIDGLMEIGAINEFPPPRMMDDVEMMIDDYYGRPLRDFRIGDILNELLALSQKYNLRFPRDFILLGKTLLTIEGIGKKLDPEFNMLEVARPYARKLMLQGLEPKKLALGAISDLKDTTENLMGLPGDFRALLRYIRSGQVELGLKHLKLEKLYSKMDIVSNRLSLSLIVSAIIVGSSLIIQGGEGPTFGDFSLLGLIGFSVAGVLGLWLIISILRSGRF